MVVVAVVVVVAWWRAAASRGTPRASWSCRGLAKYSPLRRARHSGVVPIIERMYQVDIREVLVEAQPQEIITNDNLNAKVDAQVYLKVKADEESVKASLYNVTNYQNQVVNLARTTLRNIIGTLSLKSANWERGKINEELHTALKTETAIWASRSCAPSSRRSIRRTMCRRP